MNKGKINELMKADSKKKYISIDSELLDTIEKSANAKMENNSNRGLSESYIEARTVLQVLQYIRDNSIIK